jgi:hypothetical protein
MPMHPDEEKMFAELKQELGDDAVKGLHPHELDKATIDAANIMIITMDAGDLEQATDMAIACNDAVARSPTIKFILGINGCRDDPREVDQIPEARASLRTLRSALTNAAYWRFDLEHQGLMAVASGAGYRHGSQLHIPAWVVRQPE